MNDDFMERFSGVGRLFSAKGLERLRASRVCVIGIGGVGVWAAEALARSGIGTLTLVDMDDLCYSNTNRQLHALDGHYGQLKVEAMAERIRAINPACQVEARTEYFTASSMESILGEKPDCIVDAIDSLKNKALLLAECRKRGLRIATTAGAGGRRDPTQVRVADLTGVFNDPLAAQLRKKLRREYGFPGEREGPFGIPCVFSKERAVYPRADGTVCAEREAGADYRLNCDVGFGTAAFVTGAFGLAAAGWAVDSLSKETPGTP